MLSVIHRAKEIKQPNNQLQDFEKFKEQTYPYLTENLLLEHFNRESKTLYKFEFWTRNKAFPILIKSNCYQVARLSYYRLLRNQKSLKYVRFYHDRLLTKVNVI